MLNQKYIVKNIDGESLDKILWSVFGEMWLNYWDDVLNLNPGIAEMGDVLRVNSVIILPMSGNDKILDRIDIWT